jgi:hypothetical protein
MHTILNRFVRSLAAALALLAAPALAEFTCVLSFPSAPSTALANFPVLVRLAEGAPTGFSYSDCPTGGCLWFTDANDDPIPCDVDTWDTTGTSLVWVSVPSLSDAATVTMHWDAAGAPAGLPASSQVWSLADYVGVWHMNEILEDNGLHYTPDASASGWTAYKANEADGYPLTISDAGNATTAPPTGHAMVNQLGGNRNIGGFVVPSTLTSGTTLGPFTVSFFEECTSTGNDRAVAFGSSYTEGCVTAAKSNTYVMAPGGFNTFNYGDGLADNAWRHIAGVFDTNLAGYVGGAYRNLNKNVGNRYSVTLSKGLGLGTFTTQGETFTGYLDEIRIRSVASTGEWIAEEYKTVTTANYVSFGAVNNGVEVLRLGAIAVTDVTPTNALVTGELRTLGENATSADVWLVYTDGSATNRIALGAKSAEPSALSATLENLAEQTTYTCWFTATNNLSAGADSATASFKTKRIPTGTGIYECELSFPSAPATPLENFPVLVRLANDAPEGFLYEDCPTAAHLWFTDGYDTVLPFEADTWNTAGESLVWVSVPSFSSSTTITMHWANDAASVEDSPPSREVWTRAGYNAVWHFSGSNAESVTNLVPSAMRGTPTYDGNVGYPGPVGKTLWLDGSSDLRYAPDPAWTTLGVGPALSVSFWARHTGSNPGYTRMVSCMSDWSKTAGYELTLQTSFTKITVGTSSGSQLQTDITTGPNSKWKHFTGTYSGTTLKFYDDGTKKGEGTKNVVATPTEALTLGGTGGTSNLNPLTGGLDEIRIRRVTSSEDWVAAEYATMAAANYVSFGDVEEAAAVMSFEFGTPSVSSVSATGATISARLKGIGENATSANLWVVVSGFGQTRAYPLAPATEPKVVEATLSGLQSGADWTAYLTATNNLGAGVASALAAFSTLSDAGAGSAGLYQAVAHTQATAPDAAANWDIAASDVVTLGPLAMRSSGNNHDAWQSVDGTPFTWADNTGFGYAGYMYMEGGKDYWFGASADDAGYVWVDNGDANWDAKRTATQFGGYNNWNKAGPYAIAETGYYRVVFASWNGSGGAGAEPTTAVLYPKLRYIALESGASAPTANTEGWQDAVDPGDGSLFVTEAPTRAVSVLSAVRDGTLLSARVAVGEAFPGEASDLRYVYGATNGGSDPADWEGGSLVASSLPATAVTNDYLVAIAADTRYVRFYTQDGDAVTWSATVSLDWAGEGSIAAAFAFLGDPDASAISGDSATLSAVLNAPGADATSAQAWFVLSGGGETRTIPAGTATARTNLAVAVTGLAPETAYTFYATATNNAATPVGVDSAVATFTTGAGASAWNTARATFTPDGKSLTATVPVTSLGVGTTTLYLMTGNNWNTENTVADSVVVTEPGTYSLAGDFSDSPWGTRVYYSLMLVNGTAESAVTNWPNQNVAGSNVFYNKWFDLQDNSTYTWIGGSAGVWTNTANWELTAPGSLAPTGYEGYPVFGSTALFATAAGDDPIVVTIPETQGTTRYGNATWWWVSALDVGGMNTNLVFISEDKTVAAAKFRAYALANTGAGTRLVFDDCNVYLDNIQGVGASAADENGENFTITLTGGTTAQFNGFKLSYPGTKVRVEDGATLNAGGLSGGSVYPPPVLEIDGGTVTAGKLEPDTWSSVNGTMVRLVGAGSVFTPQWLQLKYATSTNVFEFVVPVGGYTAVPVRFTSGSNKFPNNTNDAKMTFRVPKESPGLGSVSGKYGIQLLQSPGGVNAANVRFEDVRPNYCGFFFKDADGNAYADAAAISAAGKTAAQITQIWYRPPPAATVLIVK